MIDFDDIGYTVTLGLLVIVMLFVIITLLICAIAAPLEMLAITGLCLFIGGFAYSVGYIAERILDRI